MTEMQTVSKQVPQSDSDIRTASDWAERTLVPPVDIFEEDDAVVIVADMPGVTGKTLGVEVGNHALTLEGDIALDMPEGVTATHADVRASRYARRFTLGDEIDTDGIKGTISNGVVTVRLPKRESHRRRRIEIKTA